MGEDVTIYAEPMEIKIGVQEVEPKVEVKDGDNVQSS